MAPGPFFDGPPDSGAKNIAQTGGSSINQFFSGKNTPFSSQYSLILQLRILMVTLKVKTTYAKPSLTGLLRIVE